MLERRAKALEARGLNPAERKLVVSIAYLFNERDRDVSSVSRRSGLPRAGVHITQRGLS